MDKYSFIVNNDFFKVVEGIKNVSKKVNSKDAFFKRRGEFAALTREGYSMGKIAQKFGITRQAVSLALQKAVKEGHVVYKNRASDNDCSNYKIISRKRLKEIKCSECGNLFKTDKKVKHCSKECVLKFRQKTYGGDWSRVSFIELLCKGCGKTFKRSKYLHKINEYKRNLNSNYYCSRECYCNSKKIWEKKQT